MVVRVFAIVTLLSILCAGAVLQAQVQDDAYLATVNAGVMWSKSKDGGESLEGNSLNLTFERFLPGGHIGLGFSIGFIRSEGTVEIEDSGPSDISYTGTPLLFTFRYVIGRSWLKGYAGAGVGVHFSGLKEFAGTIEERSVSYTGMALGLPIGAMAFIAKDMAINVNYVLTFMDTTPLRDEFAQTVNLGLVFQFGGVQPAIE